MSLTSRVLPREEWPCLAETDVGGSLPGLRETDAQIVVAEDEGRIVGHWVALRCVHVEGVWIDPSYRKQGGVARRLLRTMRGVLRGLGTAHAITAARDDDVRALIGRLGGVVIPFDHYVLPLGQGRTPCR